jgi:hypothetical protein
LRVYQFGVDSEFPTVPLQLDRDTVIPDIKLGEAYNLTFTHNPAYREWIDYAQIPSEFEAFSVVDQQKIRDRMKRIEKAVVQGINLDENGPFMIEK